MSPVIQTVHGAAAPPPPLFSETQRPDMRKLVLPSVCACALIVIAMVAQVCYDVAKSDFHREDLWMMAIVLVLLFVSFGAVIAFARKIELRTEVRPDGVHLRQEPPMWSWQKEAPCTRIALDGLLSHEPVTFSWAVLHGCAVGKGMLSSRIVRGDRGVRLVFEDGRRIHIGSQRAEELDRAIGKIAGRGGHR